MRLVLKEYSWSSFTMIRLGRQVGRYGGSEVDGWMNEAHVPIHLSVKLSPLWGLQQLIRKLSDPSTYLLTYLSSYLQQLIRKLSIPSTYLPTYMAWLSIPLLYNKASLSDYSEASLLASSPSPLASHPTVDRQICMQVDRQMRQRVGSQQQGLLTQLMSRQVGRQVGR